MYIPQSFAFDDETEKIIFMQRYSFATMVTAINGRPVATKLPFCISNESGKITLSSHFAAANEQAKYIEESESLIIFSEPHAYISPAHYDKVESVPTWDYIAVHAYGKAKVIHDDNAKLSLLEQMIRFYEQDYLEQWKGLSDKFKKGMMRGIVAFGLEVTELPGQKKLSQNKTQAERDRIVGQLEKSGNTNESDIAAYIKSI